MTLDRSTIRRDPDPLERRGLVSVTVGETDGRERVIRLTASGEAAITAAPPAWRTAQDWVAELVAPATIDTLARRIAAPRGT